MESEARSVPVGQCLAAVRAVWLLAAGEDCCSFFFVVVAVSGVDLFV